MNNYSPIVALSVALLSGCTLAPHYERPAAPVAQAWPNAATISSPPAGLSISGINWQSFLGDPRLQKIVALALENNRDLRVSVLNVAQTRAQYRIQQSALLPAIDATGSGSRGRTPADLSGFGQPFVGSQYGVGVGVTSYELDLFGRVQSLKNQALESYFATEEAQRSAELTLVAEVAAQYFTERAYEEQYALARQTLETVQRSYALTKRSFETGNSSELDLRTAEAQLHTAEYNLSVYSQQHALAENALILLVGQPLPSDLPTPQSLEKQSVLADISPGLPSGLLQRRPDILQAEHVLKSANANIGAARAAFFPKITLTGSAGTSSAELSRLFKAGAKTWSFAPQITLPIFAGGYNRANLDVAKISKQIEVAHYEKAIQTAFREVADALTTRAAIEEQISTQVARVSAEQKRYDLSDLRYRHGVDNYLTVLLAQQDLYNAQQTLIQARLSRLSNLITLYKALGGGWGDRSMKVAQTE